MNESPRYRSLSDYVRVIRANWLLVGAVAIVFAAAALLVSLRESKVYGASATVPFRDVSQDLAFLGTVVPSDIEADKRAAANAELVTRPAVARVAARILDSGTPAAALAGNVSAEASLTTGLVAIEATWSEPVFAARLANAYARAARRVADREQDTRLALAARRLRGNAARLGGLEAQAALERVALLEMAQSVTQPVQLVERAQPPSVPISPRPRRNTVLGAMVGLIVGLLVAFLRDALDRRLRHPRDVHAEIGLPVLGRVAEADLGFSLSGEDGQGAHEPDLEAFRVLRTNLGFLSQETAPKTVLVTSGLPGEGKSTVSLALAMTSALAGRRTLLVECDLRRPSLAARLGASRAPGLTDYLTRRATPPEILQTVDLGPTDNGADGASPEAGEESGLHGRLVCITAGSDTNQPAELLGSDVFRDFLSNVGDVYEMVVLDSSPILPVVDSLELVPHVDGILMCVRLSQTTRDEARAARDALARLPERPTGIVVTGLRPDASYGYYSHSYDPAD